MEEEQKQNTQQAKEEHTATSPKHMSIRSILGGDILKQLKNCCRKFTSGCLPFICSPK